MSFQRELLSNGTEWEKLMGYSRGVRVGPMLYLSGITAAAPDGGAVGGDDMGAQTREVLRRATAALADAGGTIADVVRTRMYVTDIGRWEEAGRAHGEVFRHVRPATSMLEVCRLIHPPLLVEIELDAYISDFSEC